MRRSQAILAGRRVFVAGGALTAFIGKGNPNFIDKKHPDFGKKNNLTIEELTTKVTTEAMHNVGLNPADVDRIAIGNFAGELFVNQGHMGAAVIGSHPGLMNKPSMRVEGACASGALAVQIAHDAIKAGADIALAIGCEVQTTVSPRQGGDYLARASHYARQRSIDDFTFPCLFARRMKGIAAAGHFDSDDTARVAVKAYENGNRNPLAHYGKCETTFENASTGSDKNPKFLSNEEYKDYLRVSDCSQVSDGAAAVVLVSEEGMKKLQGGRQVKNGGDNGPTLLPLGTCTRDAADLTRMSTSAVASQKALSIAGVKGTDLQVAEVHDCFTIAELLMYEALGLCDYGEAKNSIRNGDTNIDGRIPVNTGGGLLSFGHPVGATGVKQIFEIYRQMKGQCGDYQMKSIPSLGAALNMGGDDKTGSVHCNKELWPRYE